MDMNKSKNTRRSHGEGPSGPKEEYGSRTSTAGSNLQLSSSTRPSQGSRAHSEPLLSPSSPSKARNDSRTARASVPAVQKFHNPAATGQSPTSSHSSPPEINFAVLGAEGSGKSTFIRCALDLKKPASSPISFKKMSLEGDLFHIRLIETPMADIEVMPDEINWPEMVEDTEMPRIDGVLVVCDVAERKSVKDVPRLLDVCSKRSLPCVLVVCKCDLPAGNRQLDLQAIEQSCREKPGIECFKASVEDSDTYKRCISILLKNLIPEKQGHRPPSNGLSARARATTTSHFSNTLNSSHSHNTRAKHGRAASEVTRQTARGIAPGSLSPSSSDAGSPNTHPTLQSPMFPPSIATTPTISEVSELETETLHSVDSGLADQLGGSSKPSETSLRPKVHSAVLDPSLPASYFSEVHEERHEPDATSGASEETREDITGCAGTGFSFDELVDRLLSQPMSKSDSKFAAIFLCLYRKFAAPAQLLSGTIRRFESLTGNHEPHLIRTRSQLRYLEILAQWIEEYPGDFAHPVTRHQMTTFVSQLSNNRVFAAAAKEMGAQIDVASEDDDTDWACSDTSRGRASTLESFSSVVSMRGAVSAMLAGDSSAESSEIADGTRSEEQYRFRTVKHSKTSSSTSSGGRSGTQSAASFSILLSSLEDAQRQAELLTPAPRVLLTKDQWHLFMDTGDDEIAQELTRIDWIMYLSVRPRDLIRHVSLSAEQKEKCRSLEHVNRMINQFNHVAFWVANLILLRDKPKHRARALEKFMGIAWKLRQLNNYNSLGAVIAGINGTAVHRLVQTRELVSEKAQKDFMRLEILMGTQKSHFAYRLAWENTTTERIPFLPLHRRDLVSAEEGNRTFIGEKLNRINWKKFEVMGEVIVGVQRSQGTPYPNISRNLDVQRLILDGKFSKDDDELYERSIQLEGPGVGENTRKRFNWFQR